MSHPVTIQRLDGPSSMSTKRNRHSRYFGARRRVLVAFLRARLSMSGATCPASVTHDLTSATGPSANFAYIASDNALLRQTLRPIEPTVTVLASRRRLPVEAPPLYRNQSKLDWEYDETRSFLQKQLRQDPRAQPADFVIDDSHLNLCMSCVHDNGLHTALQGEQMISISNRTQPMVDDWTIYSWENVVRFLNKPAEKGALGLESHNDVRFGCPCGSMEMPDGTVKLYYSSGPHSPNGDGPGRVSYKNRYSTRQSANGRTGWTEERQVQVNSHAFLGTFTPTPYSSLPPRGNHPASAILPFVAGYEDKHGGACVAYSRDGNEFYNLDNTIDRTGNGLNDDCLENSNDYLGRAGDTYIQPVVDPKRSREMVIYRQDFGQEGGWREVRGIQIAQLNQRFAEIPLPPYLQTGVSRRLVSWYLDRLGKLEHYRRHVYCVTLTPYDQDLWLGVRSSGPQTLALHPMLQRGPHTL